MRQTHDRCYSAGYIFHTFHFRTTRSHIDGTGMHADNAWTLYVVVWLLAAPDWNVGGDQTRMDVLGVRTIK